MELNELMDIRRSVREYAEGDTVSREDLEAIVKAAQKAPTWKNTQTGRFYVAASPEMVAAVREQTLPGFNQRSTANAPAYVITTFEKSVSGFTKGEADNELGDQWGAYDLGLSNGYMILKAAELGLDTLIMGLRDDAKLRELLDIPDSQQVAAVIAVGHRVTMPPQRPRKAMEEVARFF